MNRLNEMKEAMSEFKPLLLSAQATVASLQLAQEKMESLIAIAEGEALFSAVEPEVELTYDPDKVIRIRNKGALTLPLTNHIYDKVIEHLHRGIPCKYIAACENINPCDVSDIKNGVIGKIPD